MLGLPQDVEMELVLAEGNWEAVGEALEARALGGGGGEGGTAVRASHIFFVFLLVCLLVLLVWG